MELPKEKEIKRMSFGDEDCHIAVVHSEQGGAANGFKEALILRAEKKIERASGEVAVKLSFEEFLRKFFNVFYDDATIIAKALGFSVDGEENLPKYIEDKVEAITIMRAVKDFSVLSEEAKKKVVEFQSKVEDVVIRQEEKMTQEKVEELTRSLKNLEEALEKERALRKELEEKEIKRAKESVIQRAKEVGAEGVAELLADMVAGGKQEDAEVILRAFDEKLGVIKKLEQEVAAGKKEEDLFRSESIMAFGEEDSDFRERVAKKNKGGK